LINKSVSNGKALQWLTPSLLISIVVVVISAGISIGVLATTVDGVQDDVSYNNTRIESNEDDIGDMVTDMALIKKDTEEILKRLDDIE